MSKIIIVSGGFDPLHAGHIKHLKAAKELGNELIVILNDDCFLKEKKGYVFMDFAQRYEILEAIKYVDCIVRCIDTDISVSNTLRYLNNIKEPDQKLIFAKGGDRTIENIPEADTCRELGIDIVSGIGGEKIQSSSELVAKVKGV
jgi:D-beta-D-heptose 7-phosphate kinase/D-beta-D-heptose 1-phosphate adenosyltransferase